MSVNLGDDGEEPMIFYRDPMQFMTHLADKHGNDAVMGMAGLIGWSQGPAKALGRFDVRTPPKTLDEMYACAANEAERTAIHDVLFGRPWMRSTATCPTSKSTPSCEACSLSLPSTRRTAGPTPRQRNMSGVRAGRSRRHHGDDDEAGRRHRRAVRSPAPAVRRERR